MPQEATRVHDTKWLQQPAGYYAIISGFDRQIDDSRNVEELQGLKIEQASQV